MQYKTLDSLCKVASGGTPSRSKKEYWDGGDIPWIKIGNIKSKVVSNADEYITEAGLNNSSAKLFKKGTILYTIFATLGEVGILDFDACTNQAIAGISIEKPEEITTDYLYYYLKSKKAEVNQIGRGVAQNNINLSILRKFSIPLRDIEDQKTIVGSLNKVESIIEKQKRQLERLDELIKARFVEMFGMPGADPFGYGIKELGKCCELNPKKAQDKRLTSNIDVSFIPMPSVSENGDIDPTDIRSYEEVKKGFTYFAENDVLFAKITPCMENGKGAVARGLKNGIGFGSTEFHVLRPIKDISNPYWIYVLTSFKSFRKDAEANMTGSAGQRRTPVSFLDNYKVALPPIYIQNQFAAFVAQVDKSKFAVQKSLEKTQQLFDSLMQEYFG